MLKRYDVYVTCTTTLGKSSCTYGTVSSPYKAEPSSGLSDIVCLPTVSRLLCERLEFGVHLMKPSTDESIGFMFGVAALYGSLVTDVVASIS